MTGHFPSPQEPVATTVTHLVDELVRRGHRPLVLTTGVGPASYRGVRVCRCARAMRPRSRGRWPATGRSSCMWQTPACSAWSRSPPHTGSASRPSSRTTPWHRGSSRTGWAGTASRRSPGDRRPAAAARDARRGGLARRRPRTGHPTGRTRPRARLWPHLGEHGRRAARALGGCDRLGAQPSGSGFPVSSNVLSALRISVDPPDTCSSVEVPAGIPECSIVTRVNASPIGSIRNS